MFTTSNIPTKEQTKKELLKDLAGLIDAGRDFEEGYYEGYYFITLQFEFSPEGVTIGIYNSPKHGLHFTINAWPYPWSDERPKDQVQVMEQVVGNALKYLPDAVLTLGDDNYDYNPNSVIPEYHKSYNDYHHKTNDPNEWKKQFQVN